MKLNKVVLAVVWCISIAFAGEPQIVVPDFQVNEAGGAGKLDKYNPMLKQINDDRMILVWVDKRYGRFEKIFGQLYTLQGDKIGANQQLTYIDSIYTTSSPAVTPGENGEFLLTWQGNDHHGYFAQLFDKDANPLAPYFSIHEGEYSRSFFDNICVDYHSRFHIVWNKNAENDTSFVFMTTLDESGTNKEKTIILKKSLNRTFSNLTMSYHKNGEFLLTCWEPDSLGYMHLTSQVFDTNGNPVNEPQKLLKTEGFYFKTKCIDVDEGFVVPVFKFNDNNFARPEFLRISLQGELITTPLDSVGQEVSGVNVISKTNNNTFYITWQESDYNNMNFIKSQEFSGSCEALGDPFVLYESDYDPFKNRVVLGNAIYVNNQINFCVTKHMDYNYELFTYNYSLSNNKLDENEPVDDFIGFASQKNPRVMVDANKDFRVFWRDDRFERANYDIFEQGFNIKGERKGNNLNLTQGSSICGQQNIFNLSDTGFLMTWIEKKDDTHVISVQQYSSSLEAVGKKIELKENNVYLIGGCPQIASLPKGPNIVCFTERGDMNDYTSFLLFDKQGNSIGEKVQLDDMPYRNSVHPFNDTTFIVLGEWVDCFFQMVSSKGVLGINVDFDGQENLFFNPVEKYLLGFSYKNLQMIMQRFNVDGSKLDSAKVTFDEIDGYEPGLPRVLFDSIGNFVVTWTQDSFNINNYPVPYLWGQYFNRQAEPVGSRFLIKENFYFQEYDLAYENNILFLSWEGFNDDQFDMYSENDIWARILDLTPVITSVEENSVDLQQPHTFQLLQNYPNPFNPVTQIRYSLAEASRVNLTIYDTLGRNVRTLIDARQSAGYHNVDVDAGKLPSGVYFYKLQCGSQVQTRKMLLLR